MRPSNDCTLRATKSDNSLEPDRPDLRHLPMCEFRDHGGAQVEHDQLHGNVAMLRLSMHSRSFALENLARLPQSLLEPLCLKVLLW